MSADKKYYLGLDIGTDSVGYAATDEYYYPLKFKGEPVMGVTTFEAANPAQERRQFRTARRRIDRRQQRVQLLNEIFAAEIGRKDPRFFIRRQESALYRDETQDRFIQFNDPGFTDTEYYTRYPTVHHLIVDLMQDKTPKDIRLVYIACAWLIAHRGHFLFDVAAEATAKLLDFDSVYEEFCRYFADNAMPLPWGNEITGSDIRAILIMNAGVTRKKEAFKDTIFKGKKPPKTVDEEYRYSREAVCNLLSGAKVKPEELFQTGAYTEVESVSLSSSEEDFARVLSELGEEGELLRRLRALQDCALLIVAQHGKNTVSEAKVAVYEQHRKDLADLKQFIRKYLPTKYNAVFRKAGADNYTAYSYHAEKEIAKQIKSRASKDAFSDYLLKLIRDIKVKPEDEAFCADMKERLAARTFLPKQKDTDNRVIPQQLYRFELKRLLDNAQAYLPMLSGKDETGLTAKEKILSIFDFRIPYFVGPLNSRSSHAWLRRKGEGCIYPWNFEEMVDLDASEQAFIDRMTNTCSYLAGESVLPVHSLLYEKFTVLNEINNIKIDGAPVTVEIKQAIYTDLMQTKIRVSRRDIVQYMVTRGIADKAAEITGVDIRLNSSLYSYHQFKNLLKAGTLTEAQAERVIERAAYSEDKVRFLDWLSREFPQLTGSDRKYIIKLNLKEFGRLSAGLLTGVEGTNKATGEVYTVMQALWETNDNLMQLLSDRYTFAEEIGKQNKAYYAEHPADISARLDEMYISNAVKRPILRTLEICRDVVKAEGCAPKRIFVEMARDASGDKAGQRTETRKEKLLAAFKKIKDQEVRALEQAIADMGIMADNRLQSDKLFLYYLQLGRDAYTGRPIDITRLTDGTYNIDHIYPQSFVKDDSIMNNKVLVDSNINGAKQDVYPLDSAIRHTMTDFWAMLRANGLMTDEKFKRLTRGTPFTDEERWGFINRQLVETRQSTKAVAELLQERYPETEIVYVKAGLVSEFRQEYGLLKSRAVNNLHHAKDAYLNIVVGNVYYCRFNKNWFRLDQKYSVNTKALFGNPLRVNNAVVWQGGADIAKIKDCMSKDHIHMTRYAFCKHGKLFDQMPVKAGEGQVPLKKGKDIARYGGYNKPSASFFSLVKYTAEKKNDIMFMPVELMVAERYLKDKDFALEYAKKTVGAIIGKPVLTAEILLGGRPLKVNTMLEMDGLRMVINGKSGGGSQLILSLLSPLLLPKEMETYIKKLESFINKRQINKNLRADQPHDGIDPVVNLKLYDMLIEKMQGAFAKCPGNQAEILTKGRDLFIALPVVEQAVLLLTAVSWFGPVSGGCDLTGIGGSKRAGAKYPTSTLCAWTKKFSEVRIIDASPSGLFVRKTENLLSLL